MKPNSLAHISRHESAHIVTAIACGHLVTGAYVDKAAGTGRAFDTMKTDTNTWQVSNAMCFMAGPIISAACFGMTLDVACGSFGALKDDYTHALMSLRKIPGQTDDSITRILSDCIKETTELLKVNDADVTYIANTLQRRKSLNEEFFLRYTFNRHVQDHTDRLKALSELHGIDNRGVNFGTITSSRTL